MAQEVYIEDELGKAMCRQFLRQLEAQSLDLLETLEQFAKAGHAKGGTVDDLRISHYERSSLLSYVIWEHEKDLEESYRLLIVQKLLSLGARPDHRGLLNVTPLHKAAGLGSGPILKLLIEHVDTVDLNPGDNDNWTPLHFACANEKAESIRVLLEAGAIADIKDKDGDTPLDVVGHFSDHILEDPDFRAQAIGVFKAFEEKKELMASIDAIKGSKFASIQGLESGLNALDANSVKPNPSEAGLVSYSDTMKPDTSSQRLKRAL